MADILNMHFKSRKENMKKLIILFLVFFSTNAYALTVKVTKDGSDDVTLTAFAKQYGYSATIKNAQGQDIDNPESEIAFAGRKVREFVAESAVAYDANKKADVERAAEITSAKERHVVKS